MDEPWIPNPAPYPSAPPSSWPALQPPEPAAGPPQRPRRDATAVIVAAALAFAVLVVAGIGWAVVREGDRGSDAAPEPAEPSSSTTLTATSTTLPTSTTTPASSGPSSSSPPPSSSPTPPTTTPGGSLDAAVEDLITFVERERGHRFRKRPEVKAIAAGEFDAKLATSLAGERASIAKEQVTFRALGLIEPQADLFEVYERLLSASAVGFYDPETEELYVEGERITALRRVVIVHELTHALDDQYFNLQRTDAMEKRPDESAFGFLSLIEGSAKRVEAAYRESLSDEEEREVMAEETQLASGLDTLSLPVSVLLLQQIPYTSGEILARQLVTEGGNAGLDRSFRVPPATSEQVLEPTRYERREAALTLTPPVADGTAVERGAFGAVDLLVTLIGPDILSALDSLKDPRGWGGGAFVSWRQGSGACARLRLVGDTEGDTARFRDDLAAWADGNAATVIEVADSALPGRSVLEATRCA